MRIHFAGFVETIYNNLVRDEALALRYFTANSRATLLNMFERWVSPAQPQERSSVHDVDLAATRGTCRAHAAGRPSPRVIRRNASFS